MISILLQIVLSVLREPDICSILPDSSASVAICYDIAQLGD